MRHLYTSVGFLPLEGAFSDALVMYWTSGHGVSAGEREREEPSNQQFQNRNFRNNREMNH